MSDALALQKSRRGRELASAGDLTAALVEFEQVVRVAPGLVDGWFFLGVTLSKLGRPHDAGPALRRALALAPHRIEIIGELAYAEFDAGDFAAALPLFRSLCDAKPLNLDASLKLGECLSQLGKPDEAAAAFRGALARSPEAPGLWLALGQACDEGGHRADAEHAYRRALDHAPGWPRPVAGLLALQRSAADQKLIERAQAMFDDHSLASADRIVLGHELGKAYDARGAYAAAWECWTRSNAMQRASAGPLDRDALALRVKQKLATTVTRADAASADPRPVFIVGMPRSGTTLVEQIIAAHPLAAACGEMREIPMLAATAAQASDAAARYLSAAATRGAPDSARLVDKQPLNLFNLDAIARWFANARVIWCRRDPRDVGLSIFSELMSPDARFATDLADIAHFYDAHIKLMSHWQTALHLSILEVDYECLVDSFADEAQRIVEFTGLEWDLTCLDFHRAAGAVQTPSRWQVRRPVHRGSVGRWRHYERELAPLINALKPVV